MPGRDPALRPYRIAAWAAYIGLIALVVALMVVSITRTLRSPATARAASRAVPTRAALRICLQDLEVLFREQNRHAWALADDLDPKDPMRGWTAWSVRWNAQLDDLSDRCRLDDREQGEEGVAEREELSSARDAMQKLNRAYNVQMNRFTEEHRDLTQDTAEALAQARQAIAAPR